MPATAKGDAMMISNSIFDSTVTLDHLASGLIPHPVALNALEAMTAEAPRCEAHDDDAECILFRNPDYYPDAWERGSAKILSQWLGAGVAELNDALSLSSMKNVLHIRGLPVEKNPPLAPYRGSSDWARIPQTLINVFGIVHLMHAYSFAYATENSGKLVRDVVARNDAHDEYSSQGWAHALPWHMDGAFRPLTDAPVRSSTPLSPAPRWLVFGVIYDNPKVPMVFASLNEVLSRLSARVLKVLAQPLFNVRSADSFEHVQVSHGVPILLSDGEGGYYSRFNQLHCDGVTRAARHALAALTDVLALPELQHQIDIAAGDVVVLDNWRSLHMRSAYTPRWDGADRWLVRLYAAPDARAGVPLTASMPRIWI